MQSDLVTQALDALRRKDYATARDAIGSYALDNPLELQHYLIKGLSELALEDWAAARDTFTVATEFFPHQAQLWLNRGVTEENLDSLDEAAESFAQCLDLDPKQGDACGNLSNIYRKQGRFAEAETMAHRAYERSQSGTAKSLALNCLGLVLGKRGQFAAAEKTLRDALRLDPGNADILANLANLAVDQLNFAAAWSLFAAARTAKDKAAIRRDEGMARLLAGDDTGWPLYEARLDLPAALRIHPPCPLWRGEPLMGKKLMLLAEQGFGDTIMFCRYGNLVAESGADILWVVQKPLQRLLKQNLPGQVFAETDPLPMADYYLPLLSLPSSFSGAGMPLRKEIPIPYLLASSELRLPNPKPGMKKIGLVWAGSPTHQRDHERSILLEQFTPLFKHVAAQFYAVFTGAGLEEITAKTPVLSLENHITDFADTAALLSQLDCLIAVDTATAHLAGALGVKTFLLLQHCPDWRWGITGETTPWYPHVILLRQSTYGDWNDVIDRLAKKLA